MAIPWDTVAETTSCPWIPILLFLHSTLTLSEPSTGLNFPCLPYKWKLAGSVVSSGRWGEVMCGSSGLGFLSEQVVHHFFLLFPSCGCRPWLSPWGWESHKMEGVWISKFPDEGELFAYPSIHFGLLHKQEMSFYSVQDNSGVGVFVTAV